MQTKGGGKHDILSVGRATATGAVREVVEIEAGDVVSG